MSITADEVIRIAADFCNKNSISSFKKRKALSVLIAEVYYKGYESGIDDFKDRIKHQERV